MIGGLARTRTFSAFRSRNFRLYWTGAIVSLTGTWVQGTALSYLVWELTRSPLATSLPTFFFSLPTMLFSLVGGVVADRVDRRRLLLVTQTLFMVQAVALALLTWLGLVRVIHIYLLSLANGLIMAMDSPARQALVPQLVHREDLTNAIALNSLVFNASRIIGPPIGGLLYALAGPQVAFLVNALSFIAILYPLAIIQVPSETNGGTSANVWTDLREGLDYTRRHAVVRTLLLLVGLMGVFGFVTYVLMPVMTSKVLGGGPAENGYLLGVVGVGASLGALLVATAGGGSRPGRRIVGLATVAALALMAFAASRSLVLSAMIAFVIGGSIIGFLSTANATIQGLVPDNLRGRVMSIYSLAIMGSGPLNSLLAGSLGNALGAPAAIAISGAMILLPMLWLFLQGGALMAFAPVGAAVASLPRGDGRAAGAAAPGATLTAPDATSVPPSRG